MPVGVCCDCGARWSEKLFQKGVNRCMECYDKYCHVWVAGGRVKNKHGSLSFSSECGYPAVATLPDGTRACKRHKRRKHGELK